MHHAHPNDGRIGLVVLGSIAGGLLAGALLDLVVFAGASEPVITGMALLALGCGLGLLAVLSSRRTAQPQAWAARPAVGVGVAGVLLAVASPGTHLLDLSGWVWPLALLALVVWMTRAARRSLRNWSRLALLYPAFAVLALTAVGGAYETVAGATAGTAPAAGRLYGVNGHALYLSCVGQGAPTVVLFNGLGERASSWSRVQATVAATTRVCVFDRAGEGRSVQAAGRQDGHQLAADAHAVLAAAHVPGPYVLAGHSVGGTYALVYAHDYANEVAGVTLVDSATPHQFELPAYPGFYSTWRRVSALLPTIARAGITRLAGQGAPAQVRADHDEFLELPTVFEQASHTTLGSKPLVVLTAGRGQQGGWPEAQARLALLSSRHVQRTVPAATHTALLDDPRYALLTSRGIDAVVHAARLTNGRSGRFQL